MTKIIDVAAGILLQKDGRFLLASRPADKIYAGYWEFPGGKLEHGENAAEALARELFEEMGIKVKTATPWIVQTFTYPHAMVRLHFFRVTDWVGEPHPNEGQSFVWQRIGHLGASPILPANGPILRGLAQAPVMAFSNVAGLGKTEFLHRLRLRLQSAPVSLILREPQLAIDEYTALAREVIAEVRNHAGQVILHDAIELAQELEADGVHLPSRRLAALSRRPQRLDWVGASTHNRDELQQVSRLGLDYAVLGHVTPTQSHPDTRSLGWKNFTELVAMGWPMPIYAIGGMTSNDLDLAQQRGAHGIAMLRAYWETP